MIAPAATTEAPLLVNSETAARMLGDISTRTLSRWTMPQGELRCVRIGRGRRPLVKYRITDLEDFVEKQATASVAVET